MRPPRTSYRLGKEHEISITRLPFHQTRTLALPRARRILRRSRHVTFNERRTMDETAYRTISFFPPLFSLPPPFPQPFFFVGFWGTSRRLFEELVNFFFFFFFLSHVISEQRTFQVNFSDFVEDLFLYGFYFSKLNFLKYILSLNIC